MASCWSSESRTSIYPIARPSMSGVPWTLSPSGQGSVPNRLRQTRGADRIVSCEVGQGAGDLENAVEGADREAEVYEIFAAFGGAFREASKRLRLGDRNAPFPAGSFPPALPFVAG
jgi:hypothetical protein